MYFSTLSKYERNWSRNAHQNLTMHTITFGNINFFITQIYMPNSSDVSQKALLDSVHFCARFNDSIP